MVLARGRGTQGPGCHAAGFEPEKEAMSKGVWAPPEPGMGAEPPGGAGRPRLDFSRGAPSRTRGLQNSERMNVCCFKARSLRRQVMAAKEKRGQSLGTCRL